MPKSKSKSRRAPRRRSFREAVEAVPPPVRDAFEPNLQALAKHHRQLISCPDAADRLTGSIDLDSALAKEQPNSPRWDYGIGFRHRRQEFAVWVEVHAVQTNKVREVLNKLRWLKDWLNDAGQPLGRITATDGPTHPFVWLASGSIRLPATSPQARQASQAGIRPRKRLSLP